MSESEDESDLDFSASEDEYVPTEEDDSDENEVDEETDGGEESEGEKETDNKKLKGSRQKIIPAKTTSKSNKRTINYKDDDDSDSSVENYLVNPNEIDLESDFFTSNPNAGSNLPTFDCNIGVNLSDSEEEVFDEVSSKSQSETSKPLDFNTHENFNRDLESAKEQLRNYKSIHFSQDNGENDVTKLLAMGEASMATSSGSLIKKRKKHVNASDESDWEEVQGDAEIEKKEDVEVRIGPTLKTKPNKYQTEIEASIKRKINLRIKQNQLLKHKVHLLSWIAYGNYVNKVLNSTKLMEMVVKFIPSDKCYPKEKTDKNYFEQIIKWYKTKIGLKSGEQNCNLKCLPPIATSLALQIQSKMAICKKDFVYIFIVLLRSMGIQCRLVINLATVPMRPLAKDLCVIALKNTDEKPGAEQKVKSSKKKKESKVDSKVQKVSSSKELKPTKSILKPEDKLKTRANSINGETSSHTKIQIKNAETSKNVKSLKRKLDEAVKNTEENPSKADSNSKALKRRSLSLNIISSINNNPKRTRNPTLTDEKLDPAPISATNSKNISVLNSPIARRTRRQAIAKSEVASKASKIVKSITQLDGGDDLKKQKPKLFKVKLPSRSRSVSKSPTTSTSKSRSRLASKSESRSGSKSVSPSAKAASTSTSQSATNSSSKSEVSKPDSTSNKPKLFKLRPTRSRSVSKSPMQSTSKSASSSPTKAKSTSISQSATNSSSKSKSVSNPDSTSNQAGSADKESKPDKLQLFKLKRPLRSRSAVTPTPSTSKSTVVTSNSASTSPIKSTTKSNTKPRSGSNTSKSTSNTSASTSKSASVAKVPVKKSTQKHKAIENDSSDSDFAPTPKKKVNLAAKMEKPLPKAVEKLKKPIDRRVLSTDDESNEPALKKNDMNYWIEVFCEVENQWMCIDLFKLKVDGIDDVKKNATKPIAYVFAWNNNNTIKDVSSRYCSQWNTTTRKLRVEMEWLGQALSRYKEPNTARSLKEDRELNKFHLEEPIPKSISELKNHPLYVLKRHLLKFEGIYPPNPPPMGFIRDEVVYARECVHTLHSREIWVKQARVVKPAESPYKIVKARPKWDRMANKMLEPQPLEIFGFWQTQPYEPPTAENGIVPRNAYGNVELFKPEMLPKKTVHLQLPGLNRVCSKLKIDCAQAVVGFDFHGGSSHPTFDGFVVCEEFAELVTVKWWEDQEEAERRSKEKQDKRIYDNWKKLIKGLLIRERLQRKYNFSGKDVSMK